MSKIVSDKHFSLRVYENSFATNFCRVATLRQSYYKSDHVKSFVKILELDGKCLQS